MCAGLLFKYVKERNYLIYLGIDDRIILKKLLKKWEWTAGYGAILGCCEHGKRRMII